MVISEETVLKVITESLQDATGSVTPTIDAIRAEEDKAFIKHLDAAIRDIAYIRTVTDVVRLYSAPISYKWNVGASYLLEELIFTADLVHELGLEPGPVYRLLPEGTSENPEVHVVIVRDESSDTVGTLTVEGDRLVFTPMGHINEVESIAK